MTADFVFRFVNFSLVKKIVPINCLISFLSQFKNRRTRHFRHILSCYLRKVKNASQDGKKLRAVYEKEASKENCFAEFRLAAF